MNNPQNAPPDEEAVVELFALAAIAIKGNLCSRLFPDFLASFRRDMDHEPTAASQQMAALIKIADDRGSHYTAEEIAKILRGRAAQIQRGEIMRRVV